MQEIKVSHAVVIDESSRLYFDRNKRLNWLTLLWWKHEEWEDDLTCLKRELPEEGGFSLDDAILIHIIRVNEILEVDWVKYNWTTRAVQISDDLWDEIAKRENVVRMAVSDILYRKNDFSYKIDFNRLFEKVLDSISFINRK